MDFQEHEPQGIAAVLGYFLICYTEHLTQVAMCGKAEPDLFIKHVTPKCQ